jgi:hypothetical protein
VIIERGYTLSPLASLPLSRPLDIAVHQFTIDPMDTVYVQALQNKENSFFDNSVDFRQETAGKLRKMVRRWKQ